MADRAVVYIDGNNWFHAIRDAGVDDRAHLDYRLISLKLLGPREWVGTRYYIGAGFAARRRSAVRGAKALPRRHTAHSRRPQSIRSSA